MQRNYTSTGLGFPAFNSPCINRLIYSLLSYDIYSYRYNRIHLLNIAKLMYVSWVNHNKHSYMSMCSYYGGLQKQVL